MSKNPTISKLGQRRQVVIPKTVCEELGLGEGDLVEVTHTRGAVVIKPRKRLHADDTLSPTQARLLRRAEGQMRRGEFVTLEQLENDLDRQARKRSRKTA